MIFPFPRIGVRHRRHIPRAIPHDLTPHLLRDIGLEPWPKHPRNPFDPLW
ncbi:hypothetical protein [Limimaricola sp.]|nr:hypothetical protein [Limimaricola sp.]